MRLDEHVSTRSGRIRRLLLHYILFVMVGPQLVFALVLFGGFDFDQGAMKLFIPVLFPISLSALFVFSEPPQVARSEPAAWWRWALAAALMFGVWAGSYFLVGKLIDPARVRFLPSALEDQVPFRPAFSLVYILLYPIFLLPFFAVRDRDAFRRLVAGYLLMFATCSAAFLIIPVAFDRPALPPPPHDLGTWILSLVHGSDPAWNCLPSEHCAVAMLASLMTWEANKRIGAFGFFTTLMIGLSTLYTKQHYLVDVLAGYGVSLCIFFALRRARCAEGALSRRRPKAREASL